MDDFKYGRATEYGDTVAVVMNRHNTKNDADKIRQQYIRSHHSYGPGERRKHYELDWTPPDTKREYQIKDGKSVNDLLYWQEERENELRTKITSLRNTRYRENHQSELGKVHDFNKDTRKHLHRYTKKAYF
jgi:hypothetical protein